MLVPITGMWNRIAGSLQRRVTNPPAEPGALPSLAPQRGLNATEKEHGVVFDAHFLLRCRRYPKQLARTRERGAISRRADRRKRQTATASPAEPGDLPTG